MHEQTLGNKQKCFLTQTVIRMEEEGNNNNRFLWYLGLHTVQKHKEHKNEKWRIFFLRVSESPPECVRFETCQGRSPIRKLHSRMNLRYTKEPNQTIKVLDLFLNTLEKGARRDDQHEL